MAGRVQTFYERNTRLFLAFGGGKKAGAIHREVWGPGVTSRDEAFGYVNELLLQRMVDVGPRSDGSAFNILDLGCGVGGSLLHILSGLTFQAEGVGVTISPAQVAIAEKNAQSVGRDEASFVQADFNALPELGLFDSAFSIEAFIHGNEPEVFFSEVYRALRDRGRLYLIDDFLNTELDNDWLRRFKRGWLTGSLMAQERAIELAKKAGFSLIEDVNLSPYLRLGRLRDHIIRAAMHFRVIRRIDSPYWRGLSGGDALQKCLQEGWITYRLLGFEKSR